LVTPSTTAPEIALSNLNVEIRSREAMLGRNAGDVDAAGQLVELLLARGQYDGRIADYERADALAASMVKSHPESGATHLSHAGTLATFHRFADALDEIGVAEREGAPHQAVLHSRATIYMAQGRFDEAEALGLWRDPSVLDASELATAAVLAGERGHDAESEKLFEKGRTAFPDVSPFPVAWVDFQRGSWLERRGDRARAKMYFAEAHAVLPTFAHAAAHLAGLETADDGRKLLEPLLGKSDDPEIEVAYADALRRSGPADAADAAKALVDAARVRYEDLVSKHPEAFADHAAQFYLGLGHDPARALTLARLNVDNRRTEPSIDLLIVAAQAAGARDEACVAATLGGTLKYASPSFRATVALVRAGCADGSL
jgi:tetratricopeptide (TPR) repeat protein